MDNRKKLGEGPQAQYLEIVNGTLYFNLSKATGKDARHIPNELKTRQCADGDDVIEPVEHLIRVFGDEWINPASSGVIDWQPVCDLLGRAKKHLQRNAGKPNYDYIRWAGKGNNAMPATNVESAHPHSDSIDAAYAATKFGGA